MHPKPRLPLPPYVLATAAALSLSGAATMAAICLASGDLRFTGMTDLPELLRVSAAGAGLAGLFSAGLFGRPGRFGHWLAALGAILATLMGAGFGAALIEGLPGLIMGPVFVAHGIIALPLVGAVWLVAMAGTHWLAMRERWAPYG